MKLRSVTSLALLCCTLMLTACNSSKTDSTSTAASGKSGDFPVFSFAWSEYPSWSVFGVAAEQGLIEKEEGKLGSIEKKWNVDIVLNPRDYDTCITEYGSSVADAVCITNMDIMAPSVTRPAVCVLPTSTSAGADACITVGIDNIDALAGVKTYGLQKSVSQYCFERVLELNGKNPADFPFENMDPGAAAQAMQLSQEEIRSIMVWNPFVMQTLRSRPESKVLFDSTSIEEEIIDMVVIAKDSLAREGGERFANAILDAFYAVNKLMENPETQDETLVALGANFSKLGAEDMKIVVKQTQFYNTPANGLELLTQPKFLNETMPAVAEFLVTHDMADTKPTFGLNKPDAQLNFDTQFLTGMAGSSEYGTQK